MADISDVEQTVADAVTSMLYPTGLSHSSIVGVLCRVYRGWPNSGTLNADLAAGVVNVTVGADNDTGRTTTRYLPQWRVKASYPGATMSASGETIAISGTPVVGDLVGAIIDAVPYAYRVQDGDNRAMVAASLNLLIQAKRLTNLHGATITIPGARAITARAVSDGLASTESRRQEKDLRIICWCSTPMVRDRIASVIDAAMDQVEFLALPDSTSARVVYQNTSSYDQAQNALLYRRDLVYTVEYPTILTIEQPSMLFGASDLNSNTKYG